MLMFSEEYRLKMTKDHVQVCCSSNLLSVSDIAIRQGKKRQRLQFILRNRSPFLMEIRSIELLLIDSQGNYAGHERYSFPEISHIKRKSQELLEFQSYSFDQAVAAKIMVNSVKWYRSSKFITISFILLVILFNILMIYK